MDDMLRRVFNARVAEVLPAPTPLDRAVDAERAPGAPGVC